MKKLFAIVAMICMTALGAASAWGLTLNFSSVENASISFDGSGHFSFPNTGTYDFCIDTSDPAGSSAVGFCGNIEGTFTIGHITDYVVYQTAPISGSGTLTISDNSSGSLSADITWGDGATIKFTPDASYGNLNILSKLNLTDIYYSGSDPALRILDSAGAGTILASFSFADPGFTLEELATGSQPHATSYSGTLSAATPLPGALILLGAGLVRLAAYGRRRRNHI